MSRVPSGPERSPAGCPRSPQPDAKARRLAPPTRRRFRVRPGSHRPRSWRRRTHSVGVLRRQLLEGCAAERAMRHLAARAGPRCDRRLARAPPDPSQARGRGRRTEKRPGPATPAPGECQSRQRPTLPRSCPRSTIGGGGLNYCVRHGNRCFPSPMTTGKSRPGATPARAAPGSSCQRTQPGPGICRAPRSLATPPSVFPSVGATTGRQLNTLQTAASRSDAEWRWSSLTAD